MACASVPRWVSVNEVESDFNHYTDSAKSPRIERSTCLATTRPTFWSVGSAGGQSESSRGSVLRAWRAKGARARQRWVRSFLRITGPLSSSPGLNQGARVADGVTTVPSPECRFIWTYQGHLLTRGRRWCWGDGQQEVDWCQDPACLCSLDCLLTIDFPPCLHLFA